MRGSHLWNTECDGCPEHTCLRSASVSRLYQVKEELTVRGDVGLPFPRVIGEASLVPNIEGVQVLSRIESEHVVQLRKVRDHSERIEVKVTLERKVRRCSLRPYTKRVDHLVGGVVTDVRPGTDLLDGECAPSKQPLLDFDTLRRS